MSAVCSTKGRNLGEDLPEEWLILKDQVRRMPPTVRAQLEPLLDDALEQARFRDRIINVARDALEQMHHDLEMTRFDLDATRKEREQLKRQLLDLD